MNYYNDNNPNCVKWLNQLIKKKLIPDGIIDNRSITEIQPKDIEAFDQVHFFAGIGGWSRALQLSGWKGKVWTGSCPCQPFSVAGKLNGTKDKRHLWPEMLRLIREVKPPAVFGEQVSSPLGRSWLATVLSDLEESGYNTAAADLCGASVGSPHIRQRIYWLADTKYNGLCRKEIVKTEQSSDRKKGRIHNRDNKIMGNANGEGLERRQLSECEYTNKLHIIKTSYWHNAEPHLCGDGNVRPIEPGLKPLVDGVSERVELIQGYGNAIIPQVAAEFISSYIECLNLK